MIWDKCNGSTEATPWTPRRRLRNSFFLFIECVKLSQLKISWLSQNPSELWRLRYSGAKNMCVYTKSHFNGQSQAPLLRILTVLFQVPAKKLTLLCILEKTQKPASHSLLLSYKVSIGRGNHVGLSNPHSGVFPMLYAKKLKKTNCSSTNGKTCKNL